MQIITPHFILFHDRISTNLSVAFDDKIQKIAPLDTLLDIYPDASITTLRENSLLMPGLINAHVHLEFSANKTKLSYGSFLDWLYSVIKHRDELMENCNSECMSQSIDAMLDVGITSFGAISSHGMDLDACEKAKQNVVFFNELIGSQALMADTLFNDFLSRLDASKSIQRKGFFPAVAIHSPYSVHPVLVKKALEIARNESLQLTAHFMESEAERDWLDTNEGEFKEFFTTLLKQQTAVCGSEEFLQSFDTSKTLFTHAIQANESELDTIAHNAHSIIHCPISNRLLGNGALDIDALNEKGIRWILATDGLSSNYALDLFEEMKVALFMHTDLELLPLAKQLLQSVTKDAADALGLNTGEIKEGKNADMLIVDLESEPSEELAIHLILRKYNISKIYINGTLEKDI